MNKKFFLSMILLTGSLSLTSCALFDDSDIIEPNIYDPKYDEELDIDGGVVAGGVVGVDNDNTPEALSFKNIGYGTYDANEDKYTIPNTYKVGGKNHMGYHINGDEDYPNATSAKNNYDLYVPKNISRTEKHTVILFVHGGAWISGFKTDVNQYIYELTNRGYIAATIKYTLLSRDMDDPTLSIFRNLDEIDACIKSIKSVLGELHFDTSKTELVIGGASSGAHLSMLYSYSRGKNSPIPIKFIVDAVGPVDIKDPAWKEFKNASASVLDAGIDKTAIANQVAAGNLQELEIMGDENHKKWTNYQTFRIANGMCGIPYSEDEVKAATDENENYVVDTKVASYQNMTSDGGGEDQLSVTYWINRADAASKFPIICAYSGIDTIVGINQFATLQAALDANGVKYYTSVTAPYQGCIYFKDKNHANIAEDTVHYNELIDAVSDWCAKDSI